MEPFTIICSTCQSRIRVRNPNLIGQLANCPKCNSIIQIELPQQIHVDIPGNVADSSALTKDALQAPDDEFRLAPLEKSGSLNDVDSLIPPTTTVDTWESLASTSPSAPPMPTQDWSSQQTARTRQLLLVGILGVSGVLFAGLLFVGFQRWYSNTRKVAQVDSKNSNAPADNVPAVVDQPPAGDNSLQLDEQPPPSDTSSETANEKPSVTSPSGQDGTTQPQPNAQPSGSSSTNVEPTVPDPSTSPSNETESNEPGAIDSGSKPIDQQPAASDNTQPAPEELPKQLEAFSRLLQANIEPGLPPEGVEVGKAPPTLEDLGLSAASDSRAVPPVDVPSQLQLKLTRLNATASLPVSHMMNLWVQLSGIPTVVDLDSLTAAGFEFDPISIKLEDGSVEKLRDALASQWKVRLEQPAENLPFMALYATHDEISTVLPSQILVSDLLENDEQNRWMVDTLEKLFPAMAGKWQIADGVLASPEGVDVPTWLWTIRLLETWRYAAKKPSQLAALKAERFATQFAQEEKLAKVDKPLKLNSYEPIPTSQLFSRLGNAAGLDIWVDWVSVSQLGLGPSSSDLVITQGRTLRQALRSLVEKYGLIVAVENENALWITTPVSYRQQARLFVLPAEGKTAEQWRDELQILTPVGPTNTEPVQTYATPDAQFVIVRCCRPRLQF